MNRRKDSPARPTGGGHATGAWRNNVPAVPQLNEARRSYRISISFLDLSKEGKRTTSQKSSDKKSVLFRDFTSFLRPSWQCVDARVFLRSFNGEEDGGLVL